MSSDIESLIPHRKPFLFVDSITRADEEGVIGVKTFSRETDASVLGSFPKFGFVPGMIVIESMAQCGGAGIKKAGLADGFFGLVGMKEVVFHKGLPFDTRVEYKIRNIRVSNRLIMQSGTAYLDGAKVAEATWTCARIG